jgi:hypothetical protein
LFSFVNLFFFHAASAAKHDRGKALTCRRNLLWKRQGGGRPFARTAALSCPRTPDPQGFFSGDHSILFGENRRNLSHQWGEPDCPAQAPMTPHMVDLR